MGGQVVEDSRQEEKSILFWGEPLPVAGKPIPSLVGAPLRIGDSMYSLNHLAVPKGWPWVGI